MIVLDTNALVFDALSPDRLTAAAQAAIQDGEADRSLACCDISLWEIAMLVARGRVRVEADTAWFLRDMLTARSIRVLGITPEIAALSQSETLVGRDPADRLIAAATLHHKACLVTSDRSLRDAEDLPTIW